MKQRTITYLFALLLLACSTGAVAQTISASALADSLTIYTGYPEFLPKVKVKSLRVNRQSITVRTNKTLSTLSLSPEALASLKRQVSVWVLGHNRGSVSIYSDGYELSELITDRFRPRREHYTLPARPGLDYGERTWSAPDGLDGRNIALWPSHGLYYHQEQDRWCWQRARMWTMVEDLYSYEFTHTWLISMLENAGAYVLEPRAREGWYYTMNDNHNDNEDVDDGRATTPYLWLGDREAPRGAQVRYFGEETGPSGRPRWMEGAKYWLAHTGFPDSIWNVNAWAEAHGEKVKSTDPRGYDYKDDLQCRGLWVNYLTGGSRANPKQKGLGIQIDACLALHTDGYTAPADSDYIGTLAIYTDYDDGHHKSFPTETSRIINRDLADYVQTQIVEDIRRQVEPRWPRRELNNSGYCESRYPVVPTVLLEILSHKNLADIMLGLDPNFQRLFCRAIYKGVGRWMIGSDFVVQPLPVHGIECRIEGEEAIVRWQATTDSIEPSATADYYIVYTRIDGGEWDKGVRTENPVYRFAMQKNRRYDLRVVAGNRGGISMDGEIVSVCRATGDTTLIVNNFHQLSGPQWFIDSLRAGIVPGTYPVPYRQSRTYLGDQWIYEKQRDVRDNGWSDDDNCGWGMCHMDYAGKVIPGNSLAIETLPEQGTYMVWSSESESLTTDTTIYPHIEVECGQQRENLYPAAFRAFLERQIAGGSHIVIRGAMLGSALTREEKTWAERVLGYRLAAPRATVPTDKRNAPDAIRSTRADGQILERFPDTGLPCTIQTGNIIITTK